MTEWLNCLQSVAFGALPNVSRPSIGFPLDSNANQFNNNSNALILNNLSDSQSEENHLYSSVDAPDVYRVKLIDTETSIRCGLRTCFDSNFTLIVTTVHISLAEDGRVLFTWPYRHIRRYGCTKDGFSLEAGRKCTSGEGLFSFITKDGNYIFQAVASHVNSLKTSNNLNDDQIPGGNSYTAHNNSPKLKPKETFPSIHSSAPTLPSSSPPLSCSLTAKSNYLATNSSLLPSTKIPESSKRHSIQPPKSPQIISKQSLVRMTSANTNSMINPTDIKPKASPPISKPPRKSKDRKTSESEEPVFVTREEIMGLKPIPNNSEFNEKHKSINDEILYDETGDFETHDSALMDDQRNKSPFCPSPPPVNHTVSKLTSVLKMMFTEKNKTQIQPKFKDNIQVSSRSSTGSSGNASIASSPIRTTAADNLDDSDDVNYAQVRDFIRKDKNRSDVNKKESKHYSKILNDSKDGEHQYANINHKDINNLNKNRDNSQQNINKTEHYVQNDCEYARVVKRTNTSP